jgi:glycosyltransferase involved in cell wall biosynthesis
MPALPIIAGYEHTAPKSVLASFRGIASHPCRERLRAIHDGTAIRCEFVERTNHVGLIDAQTGATDDRYGSLMAASIFAFVSRGDALFSYRLLEAMSFGCIPVIISDNWVSPFDRTITWSEIALHIPESEVEALPELLRAFDPERLATIGLAVRETYRACFANLDAIVDTLFRELEVILAGRPRNYVRFGP